MVIKRTLIRDMPDRSRIVAKLEARIAEDGERLVGGLSPAFSLTGELWEAHGNHAGSTRHKRYERMIAEGKEPGPASEWDVGGAIHEHILRAFQDDEIHHFSNMHLADPETGEPMHAEANGWYWYSGSRADLRKYERFTGFDGIYQHQLDRYGLRNEEVGRESYCYLAACRTLRVAEIPEDLDRMDFAQFVKDQRPRWKEEAVRALKYIESLPS